MVSHTCTHTASDPTEKSSCSWHARGPLLQTKGGGDQELVRRKPDVTPCGHVSEDISVNSRFHNTDDGRLPPETFLHVPIPHIRFLHDARCSSSLFDGTVSVDIPPVPSLSRCSTLRPCIHSSVPPSSLLRRLRVLSSACPASFMCLFLHRLLLLYPPATASENNSFFV